MVGDGGAGAMVRRVVGMFGGEVDGLIGGRVERLADCDVLGLSHI